MHDCHETTFVLLASMKLLNANLGVTSSRVRTLRQRNNSLGVSPVVESGVVRYERRKLHSVLSNGRVVLTPAFIALLTVCTKLSTAPFDEG